MPDPIPGEWLSAATLAVESQPTGTPAAQVARAVLETVVPLVRASAMEGAAIELLKEGLHLRMNGERAPGGNETWRDWDQRAERHLRGLLPPEPIEMEKNDG